MKTPRLDDKIIDLESLNRLNELTEYGEETLNEFKEIKQALNIASVVGQSEQLCRCSSDMGYYTAIDSDTKRCKYCAGVKA